MDRETRQTTQNTVMLYLMTIAKMIFPLLTFPYLTRVLSEECYGVVSYVRSFMTYAQLLIDFGFLLSSVKDIVRANGNREEIGKIAGDTFLAKFILTVLALILLVGTIFFVEILRANLLLTLLSFAAVAASLLLADFLFRGIEKMHLITIVYVAMKGVSTALTFVFVRGDGDVLWIPILDLIGTAVAVAITWGMIVKLGYPIRTHGFRRCLSMLKNSFGYFISNMATTAFGALNTLLVGIFIKDLVQVAYWSVCLQIVSSIQSLYGPITNGVYPQMVRSKQLGLIHKVMLIFMPIVLIGCIICFFFAKFALLVVGGEKYVEAYPLFRCFIPVLFFSFPAMLYGWPTLGAIDKVRETSFTTIFTAVVQVLGLVVLILVGQFTLISIALLRGATELLMMSMRMGITYRNRKCFSDGGQKSDGLCSK